MLTTGVTWAIISGSSYATIDPYGFMDISTAASDSTVVVQATYLTYVKTHELTVTYNDTSESETTAETTVDESGNTTTIVTIVTENEDGSSQTEVNTTITDDEGNTIGSSETTTNNNADGSY